MKIADLGDVRLHYRIDGPEDGAPVVFANSLGTDMRLWDPILPLLPKGLKFIRFDKRGHGLSTCPPAPYSMGALVSDTEKLLDLLGVKDCLFVGLSIGGMIAQGLAVKRLDLIRAMVLSNTGAKIGTTEIWDQRIAGVRSGGIEGLADAVMERWFSKDFRAKPELELWRNMLTRQEDRGLHRLFGGDLGHGFLHHHRQPAPADAGDRRGRGRRDAARSGARNRGPDPGKRDFT